MSGASIVEQVIDIGWDEANEISGLRMGLARLELPYQTEALEEEAEMQMQDRRVDVFSLLVAGLLALLLGGYAVAQQPSPVPFDEDLSIYVGHSGTWLNYATNENEPAEIEDMVLAFEPGEDMSDDVDTWKTHQINEPSLPEGWCFFKPVADGSMQMHVIVQDVQTRLTALYVTNWDTGEAVGSLQANAEGSQIAGFLDVSAETQALRTVICAGDTMLTHSLSLQERVEKAVAMKYGYTFDPNRGDQHTCVVDLGDGPWGDPKSIEGNETTGGFGGCYVCCGPTEFKNDSAVVEGVFWRYDLWDKMMFQDLNWSGRPELSPDARAAVQAKVEQARQGLEGGQSIMERYDAPPYSQGTVHWPVAYLPTVRAVVYVPYKTREIREDEMVAEIGAVLSDPDVFNAGIGETKDTLTAALVAKISWNVHEEKIFWAEDPRGVGSVWGATADAPNAPCPAGLHGITAPVTFELWGDITSPNGDPGYIAGGGEVIQGEAWTDPAPPAAPGGGMDLDFCGEDVGRCTVDLGKGWKWSATASSPYYSDGEVGPFNLSEPVTKRITVELQVLMTLKVYTVNDDGDPVPGTVRVYEKMGGDWYTLYEGSTSEDDEGNYVCAFGPIAKDTECKVAAVGLMGDGESEQFVAHPGVERQTTVTVPPPPGPP